MEKHESSKITYIYGLYEVGKNDEIRYVGKSDNPKIRLCAHMRKSRYKSYKNNWIESLIRLNSKIDIKIIEVVNYNNWQEREIYWISEMKRLGNRLTNTTIGGEGATIYQIEYEECKKYLLDKNIKSKSEFYKWIKSDNYHSKIPKNPREVYILRNEWISWGDFLSTNKIQDNKITEEYLTYDESKKWLKDNFDFENITSKIYKKLAKYGKIPLFIPNRPERFYKNRGWISWSDFLLNENIIQNQKKIFSTYDECKKYARDNNIKSLKSWYEIKKPNNIPAVPFSCYKEWISWSEFLGVEIISDKDKSKMYMRYDECKKYICENLYQINSKNKLREYILNNKIKNIPLNPELSYKNKGWKGWSDFLGKI